MNHNILRFTRGSKGQGPYYPETIYERMKKKVGREGSLRIVYLDIKNKITKDKMISTGITNVTIDKLYLVFSRAKAIARFKGRVVMIHTRPWGQLDPGVIDLIVWDILRVVARAFGVVIKDYMVIGKKGFFSEWREEGLWLRSLGEGQRLSRTSKIKES